MPDPFRTLDPEMGEDLPGLVKVQHSFLQVFLQIGPEHPVNPSDSCPVAHQPVEGIHRPKRLDCFPEGTRREVRHSLQGVHYRLVECLSLGRCLIPHLPEEGDVPLLPYICGVKGQEGGLVEVPSHLVQRASIQPGADLLPQSVVAKAEDSLEIKGSVVDSDSTEERDSRGGSLHQSGGPDYQFAGQDAQRSIPGDAHRNSRVPVLRRKRRIESKLPVCALHGAPGFT